jgi:hypothetical protein
MPDTYSRPSRLADQPALIEATQSKPNSVVKTID